LSRGGNLKNTNGKELDARRKKKKGPPCSWREGKKDQASKSTFKEERHAPDFCREKKSRKEKGAREVAEKGGNKEKTSIKGGKKKKGEKSAAGKKGGMTPVMKKECRKQPRKKKKKWDVLSTQQKKGRGAPPPISGCTERKMQTHWRVEAGGRGEKKEGKKVSGYGKKAIPSRVQGGNWKGEKKKERVRLPSLAEKKSILAKEKTPHPRKERGRADRPPSEVQKKGKGEVPDGQRGEKREKTRLIPRQKKTHPFSAIRDLLSKKKGFF